MRGGLPVGRHSRRGRDRVRGLRSGRAVPFQRPFLKTCPGEERTGRRLMAGNAKLKLVPNKPKKAGLMRVKLVQAGPARFMVMNDAGATAIIDGPADMGGENAGLRPMETLLS